MSRRKITTPKAEPRQGAHILLIFRRTDVVKFMRPDGRIFIGCVTEVYPKRRKVRVWSEIVDLSDIVGRLDAITREPYGTPAQVIELKRRLVERIEAVEAIPDRKEGRS